LLAFVGAECRLGLVGRAGDAVEKRARASTAEARRDLLPGWIGEMCIMVRVNKAGVDPSGAVALGT
jgi:hypothetical protein